MTDPQLRDSSTVVSGLSRTEPIAPSVPARHAANIAQTALPAAVNVPANGNVFAADRLDGPDALGIEALLGVLAELAAHKNAQSPFCIGILGAAGSGKSFTLARLGAAFQSLTGRAKAQAGTPFLGDVRVVSADAAHFDGEPLAAIAGVLCRELGRTDPELVEEALRAVRDPHAAVNEAAERLDQAQRRLHQERENLTAVEGRRARLFETLLYEMPGSQVDAYVRTYRARIASRLQAFGISGDPILNYKDLVASLAAENGASGRTGLGLRALWAFKGQTKLLVTAVILALAGFGLNWAVAHQASWLAPMRSGNEMLVNIAGWFEAHLGMIGSLAQLAFLGAVLAVCANLWRAFRFLQSILRGVTLLKAEFANRRHELDSAYAHQTRRVDSLNAEVERVSRLHAEADQLAGKAVAQAATLRDASPFQGSSEKTQALNFVATLSTALQAKRTASQGPKQMPERILFLLDNLDAVKPDRGCDILDAAHRLLSSPAFVTAIAVDPMRLAAAGNATEAYLEKWVQVPVRIDAVARDQKAFIAQLVGGQLDMKTPLPVIDAQRSALDQPLTENENQLLAVLAPLAGRSARSLKRFVNLYRLARPFLPDHWASLAFMLALEGGGTYNEIEAVAYALAVAKPGADLDLSQGHPRLTELLSMVRRVENGPTAEAAKQAAVIAATFSFRT